MSIEDKRKHPRVDCSAVVNITPTDKSGVFHKGIIKNISIDGFTLETESQLNVGIKFAFEFYLPDKSIIKSHGRPKWELKSDNSNFYGVEFESISFFNKLKLKRFIKNKLSETLT
jgi:hypothetical protein